MKDVSDCIAVLAVAAWANNEDAKASALSAIEAYISAGSGSADAPASRLRDLAQAYEDMKLDSTMAVAIRAAIEGRIAALSAGDAATGVNV